MIFGDLEGLNRHDICLIGEEKSQKNLTEETCPDRESNPYALHDRRACYRLLDSAAAENILVSNILIFKLILICRLYDVPCALSFVVNNHKFSAEVSGHA